MSENLFTYDELESSKEVVADKVQAKIQIFNYQGKLLDYGLLNGEPVFNLNAIANLLGIVNPRTSIDTSDKNYCIKIDISIVGFAYNRKLHNTGELFLTESGLYMLLMRSNNPNAKPFQLWVTKEVLPSIRNAKEYKNGVTKSCATISTGNATSFSNSNLGNVRIVLQGSEPMFCLRDVAKILEIQNSTDLANAIKKEFDDGIDKIYPIIDSLGREQQATFITEPELYFVLMRSNSTKAKPFRQWVTKEVLPSIRKNGGYISGQEKLSDEELLAKALLVANNVIQNKDKVIAKQQETIADQAEIINAYQVTDKIKRNKQELATLLNRKIRELADKQYNKQYHKAYLAVYEEFAKLHCFTHKVDMQFLRTNIDYLSECLKLVLDMLDKEQI